MNGEVISGDQALLNTMQTLTARIPKNEFGMFPFYYRGDLLINVDQLPPLQKERAVELAKAPLFYNDGFPTTSEGTLFWERLPQESAADFWMFEKYREMAGTHGYRSVQVLAKTMALEVTRAQVRSAILTPPAPATTANGKGQATAEVDDIEAANQFLDDFEELPLAHTQPLAKAPGAGVDEEFERQFEAHKHHLRLLHTYFFWKHRAEAYDRVGQAALRKIRASRAILLEDHHYHKLTRMVDRTMARFERYTDEDFDKLDPVEATKILKELVGMQRVTVGLPAQAPAGEHLPGNKDADASVPIETHLKSIARSHEEIGGDNLAGALDDETTAEMAQELVIRLMRQKGES